MDLAEEPDRREPAKWETRKRETLYGDFINEASRLVADAFDHTLDNPETLVKLYAILGRIRLVSSEAVLVAAEEVSDRIIELYAEPNRKIEELFTTLHSGEMEASSASATLVASNCATIPLTKCKKRAQGRQLLLYHSPTASPNIPRYDRVVTSCSAWYQKIFKNS